MTVCSISIIWGVYRLTVTVQEVGGNSDQECLHTNLSVIYCDQILKPPMTLIEELPGRGGLG